MYYEIQVYEGLPTFSKQFKIIQLYEKTLQGLSA